MAAAMDTAVERIAAFQRAARENGATDRPCWPVIVLRTPKGWTGPAKVHCARGAGIWEWAGTEDGTREPDVVLGCAGDVPMTSEEHPHGMSDFEFDGLFTADKPVIFAYHGYPWLIHRLAYRRTGHRNLHVRGYKEIGTTTTPFDMVVRNDLDRYRLVMDVIDRVPGLAVRAAAVRQRMEDTRQRHHLSIREHGMDLPEVADWTWDG